ncbi:UbiA family prenyltransferase [Shimia biformata]|uniref:UbiA family prenyltransferase n=1 Tax=Shimia biformata TaxID=1294299 RepID=UPI0019517ABB
MKDNMANAPAPGQAPMPVFVDLDGTLVRTDIAQEQLLHALTNGACLAKLPASLAKGRAQLKSDLADWHDLCPADLPYNDDVLSYLVAEREKGRPIILATAADRKVANAIADHLGLFDGVLASDPSRNLKGAAKLDAIRTMTGGGPFEYLGDSKADLPIWEKAARVGLVDAPAKAHGAFGDISVDLTTRPATWRGILRAMRPHQWAKNALVFLPLLFSHVYDEPGTLGRAWIAFVLFCAIASSIYILNDLSDIEADRAHPRKRTRPFAAGTLRPAEGALAAVVLLALSLWASMVTLGAGMTVVFAIYVVTTILYSVWLKNYAVIDVVALTFLYTLRVFAGGVAIGHLPSVWLLNFSLFFFLSLALMKRHIELLRIKEIGKQRARGYTVDDLEATLPMGVASGSLAVLTLTLYLNSDFVSSAYAAPRLLWGMAPMVMYWIFRAWMKARRGEIGHDPVVFALRDRVSVVTIGLCCALVIAAKYIPLEGLGQ